MNNSKVINELGQSIWYDNIERRLLKNGQLAQLVAQEKVFGITSNPSIFEKAITSSTDYNDSLQAMAWAGLNSEQIYLRLVIRDIQDAADLFLPLYNTTEARDGYVSLEVSPLLADDTEATIHDAKALWAQVNRPNLMIKVPATKAGIPAVEALIAEGINVNVTLIFSIDRYREVMAAYKRGLAKRKKAGFPLNNIASVASFFISRIDSSVDSLLNKVENPATGTLVGKIAIDNAKLAYQAFKEFFETENFAPFTESGAQFQRPLWASTGTKNTSYSDVLYVDELISPNSVNTVPPATLAALLDHSSAQLRIEEDLEGAKARLAQLSNFGIDLNKVTNDLEKDGVEKFKQAYRSLINSIESKRKCYVSDLAGLENPVKNALTEAANQVYIGRLYDNDPSLWSVKTEQFDEIRNRLGWLDLPLYQSELTSELQNWAQTQITAGFTHVFVLGMGGSSLAPEVMSLSIHPSLDERKGMMLQIIDTTDPDEISARLRDVDLSKTLVIVSSKSGGTSETNAALQYFWQRYEDAGVPEIGMHFVAITDPDTSLEKMAKDKHFLKVFGSPDNVGGRFSVFTQFGLLPAATMGIDLKRLLDNGIDMLQNGTKNIPYAANPMLMLGLVLAEASMVGKNKLTFITEGYASPFVPWLEQLIAESSGKDGRGILPIDAEPALLAEKYNTDRVFVYLHTDGSAQERVDQLKSANHPVLTFEIEDAYQLGAEFYRWEYATAIACARLKINAFDQPNVQESKTIAKEKIAQYRELGIIEEGQPIWENDQAALYGQSVEGLSRATYLAQAIQCYLDALKNDGYTAINAYLPRLQRVEKDLQTVRAKILETTSKATTLGFGPRFQHSTGQFHKGGLDGGLFIQITREPQADLMIPGEEMSFGTLQRAQAVGDLEALLKRGKFAIRVHLKRGQVYDLVNWA
ncbi:MAG: bifunctional transaldolase/phosoglucose isomerase [Anaerolineaceae bacterium]